MTSNFKFLETEFPVLANFGSLAEQYCYTDPNSCLMKLGMIGETIVNLIFTYDRIPVPYNNSAVNRINVLSSEGLLTKDLVDILHALRKVRNKAVHENYAEVSDCPICLQMAYSLSEWFMQTYGDWNYQHHDFVMPVKVTGKKSTINKVKEEEKEEELTKAAIAFAEQSEKIDKKVRQKQANRMASQRQKSEVETRYMIDEQLRQVGWEANTQEIRYSKGTRPSKGRNLAIAEWPTDSTVNKKGYADYALFVGKKLVGIIEAKAEHKDIPSVIDYQGKDYPRNIRKEDAEYQIGSWGEYKVPFTFATNGRPYLEQFNEEKGTHLVVAGKIHYEPFGIYPGTKKDLKDIAKGDKIAVPNDTTNEARALLLLQDNGIIKLKDGAGIKATVNDIEENPNNIEIVELEAAQVPRVVNEVAYVVLNGNYALEANYTVKKDALAYEKSDSEAAKTYVNVIAVKEGNENSEKIKALVDVLKSDSIKKFINEKYDGAVIVYDGE